MGHRAYLSIHTKQKEGELFEANNFLPFFWITLLHVRHITGIRSEWLYFEALCMDEGREEELDRYTDGWPAPTSIKILKEELVAQARIAADFFSESITAYARLYDEFIRYLLDRLPGADDHIRLDIIAIASFSDVPVFTAYLEKTINGIDQQDINALGNLDADPVLLTGYPSAQDFVHGNYPELKALRDNLKLRGAQARAAPEQKQAKKNYFLPIAGTLLGLFLVFASTLGYRKEGATFKVVLVHVLGWLFLIAAIYGFSGKRK